MTEYVRRVALRSCMSPYMRPYIRCDLFSRYVRWPVWFGAVLLSAHTAGAFQQALRNVRRPTTYVTCAAAIAVASCRCRCAARVGGGSRFYFGRTGGEAASSV